MAINVDDVIVKDTRMEQIGFLKKALENFPDGVIKSGEGVKYSISAKADVLGVLIFIKPHTLKDADKIYIAHPLETRNRGKAVYFSVGDIQYDVYLKEPDAE